MGDWVEMAKYRHKSTVVEAEQWFPGMGVRGVQIAEGQPYGVTDYAGRAPARAYVTTIHGQRIFLSPGDWVLPDPDGWHYYVVTSEAFEDSYELVEDEPAIGVMWGHG